MRIKKMKRKILSILLVIFVCMGNIAASPVSEEIYDVEQNNLEEENETKEPEMDIVGNEENNQDQEETITDQDRQNQEEAATEQDSQDQEQTAIGQDAQSGTDQTGTTRTIYFDNVLSRMDDEGEAGISYCYSGKDSESGAETWSEWTKMTRITEENGNLSSADENVCYKSLWKADIPDNAQKIKFKGHYSKVDQNSKNLYPEQDYISQEITLSELAENQNCFYGAPPVAQMNQSSDNPGKANASGEPAGWLGGTWGNVNAVNTEGKASNMVPSGTKPAEVTDGSIYYAPVTLYDYYSDYELWGKQLSNSAKNTEENDFQSQPLFSWNIGISNYYRSKKNDQIYPLYFGGSRMLSGAAKTVNVLTDQLFNHKLKISGGNYFSEATQKNIMPSASNQASFPNKGLLNSELPIQDENVVLKNSSNATPYFNRGFLEGENEEKVSYGSVYEGMKFPFKLQSNGYYQYDSSRDNALRVKQDTTTNQYYLEEQSGKVHYKGGSSNGNFFFPFNNVGNYTSEANLDYMFGAKIEVPFSLDANRQITVEKEDGSLEKKDCVFTFSGDDDIWIFITDDAGNTQKLVLDIGGSHGAVAGAIDFKTGIVATSGKWGWSTTASEKLGYDSTTAYAMGKDDFLNFMESQDNPNQTVFTDKAQAKSFIDEKYKKYKNTSDSFSTYCDVTTLPELGLNLESYHNYKLEIYYMERGLDQSNLRVTFAFTSTKYVQVEKQWADGKEQDSHTDIPVSLYQTTETPTTDGSVTARKAETEDGTGRSPDITLGKQNKWTYTWKNLKETASSSGNGSEYHYYIAETETPSGGNYKTEYYDADGNQLPIVTLKVTENGITKEIPGVLADGVTKVVIKNIRYGDLAITKKVDLGDTTAFDLKQQAFGFTLTSDDSALDGKPFDAEVVQLDENGKITGKVQTIKITIGQEFKLRQDQKITVKALPITKSSNDKEKITYTVEETDSGGTKDSSETENGCQTNFSTKIQITGDVVTEATGSSGQGIFPDDKDLEMEFTNMLEGSVSIIKKDEKGNNLEGVKFKIQYYDDDQKEYVDLTNVICSDKVLVQNGGTCITDENGKAVFTHLKLGHKYQVTETEPLPGTNGLQSPITGIELPISLSESSTGTTKPVTKTSDGKYVYVDLTYTVTNNSFTMPVTSGNGFFWPGLFGFVLLVAGYLVWEIRKRKQEKS